MKMKKNEKLKLEDGWKKFLRHCKIKDPSKYTIEYYMESYDCFSNLNYYKVEIVVNMLTIIKNICCLLARVLILKTETPFYY